MHLDAQLEVGAASLRAAIAEFTASCTEYATGIDESLADQVQDLARRNIEMSMWVRQVADQFTRADTGQVVSPASQAADQPPDSFLDAISFAGPGFADSLDAATLNAVLAADRSPASIAQALIDSLTPEQAAQLLAMLGIANPGTGLVTEDGATQPTPFDQLGQARDGLLSFLGRVKDDPLGEAKQAEDGLGQAKDSFFGEHPTEVDMLQDCWAYLWRRPMEHRQSPAPTARSDSARTRSTCSTDRRL